MKFILITADNLRVELDGNDKSNLADCYHQSLLHKQHPQDYIRPCATASSMQVMCHARYYRFDSEVMDPRSQEIVVAYREVHPASPGQCV